MRLLCFADLHLGAGGQYPGRLDDQREVLGRIAGLAVERGVNGILFAGDAFEGPGVPPEQLQVFAQFVEACRTVEVPILAITGNGKHDAAVRDTNGLAIFEHVPGIVVESQPNMHLFAGCAVYTLPWVHPGRLIARAGRDVARDEVNAIAADLLVETAGELLRDWPSGGQPKILLGHWSVSGASLPAGLPVDQLHEPVLSAAALDDLGFDAIVMGHIHRPQGLGASHDRHILMDDDTIETYGGASAFYCGSPMPLNFGEEHVAHGVWILDFANVNPKSTFVPIDSPRFVTFDLADIDEWLVDQLDDRLPLQVVPDAIVRVRYTATAEQQRHVDVTDLRARFLEAGARHVKVEPTIVREQRARVTGVDEQLDEMAALEMWIEMTGYDGDRDALRDRARDLLETVA